MVVTKSIAKKIISMLVLAVLIAGTFAAYEVYATAKTSTFNFRIQPHLANSQTSGRSRDTDKTSNRWGVNMTGSTEGSGTATRFWLERSNATNVSESVVAYENHGWYMKSPYISANRITVYLTAEDNKDKASGYNVSGTWRPQEQ